MIRFIYYLIFQGKRGVILTLFFLLEIIMMFIMTIPAEPITEMLLFQTYYQARHKVYLEYSLIIMVSLSHLLLMMEFDDPIYHMYISFFGKKKLYGYRLFAYVSVMILHLFLILSLYVIMNYVFRYALFDKHEIILFFQALVDGLILSLMLLIIVKHQRKTITILFFLIHILILLIQKEQQEHRIFYLYPVSASLFSKWTFTKWYQMLYIVLLMHLGFCRQYIEEY